MSDKRNTPVSRSAIAAMIAERMPVKATETAIFEALRLYGEISAELLDQGKSVSVDGVGVIKPVTLKGRVYPNPQGGPAKAIGDRRGIRIDIGIHLKRRFGRA